MQQEFNKCLQSDLIIEDSPEEIIQDIDMPNADTNKIIQLLNDDLQQKQLFMQSDDFKNFTQILVVSQIIMNFSNDDPFFRHITNVYRSIRKAVKRIFLDQSIIKHKSELQQLLKIYYQDITIGFITSTGQIKSTAFIFIIRPLESALNTQRINLQKRNSLKMTMHFSSTTIRPTVGRLLSKQSFMRKNKFENEFIILQEEAQLQDKLYHVYRPIDDQIYFVKRVLFINHQIQLQNITFQDVFHNYNDKIQEAKLIGRITHPNIQRLYDWWLEQNDLFMQLEYCTYPGQRSHAKNLLSYSYFYMNPKPYEEKIQAIKDIILQIINGLEYLQKKDIHHGDLKPENIMVTITITGETQVFILSQNSLSYFINQVFISNFDQSSRIQKRANQSPLRIEQNERSQTFIEIAVLILHLVLTFPGDSTLRNNYIQTFQLSDADDLFQLYDSWASKHVRNRHQDFSFILYKNLMYLSKKLFNQKFSELSEVKMHLHNI